MELGKLSESSRLCPAPGHRRVRELATELALTARSIRNTDKACTARSFRKSRRQCWSTRRAGSRRIVASSISVAGVVSRSSWTVSPPYSVSEMWERSLRIDERRRGHRTLFFRKERMREELQHRITGCLLEILYECSPVSPDAHRFLLHLARNISSCTLLTFVTR